MNHQSRRFKCHHSRPDQPSLLVHVSLLCKQSHRSCRYPRCHSREYQPFDTDQSVQGPSADFLPRPEFRAVPTAKHREASAPAILLCETLRSIRLPRKPMPLGSKPGSPMFTKTSLVFHRCTSHLLLARRCGIGCPVRCARPQRTVFSSIVKRIQNLALAHIKTRVGSKV
jgi:hypothetical protein